MRQKKGFLPENAPPLLEEAVPRDILVAEVHAWARRLGVEGRIHEIHVRPMKRKWASCSSRGRLTFDVDLLRQPADFRARVIVHELLHLRLPNHGPLFRRLLEAYLHSYGKDPSAQPASSPQAPGEAKEKGGKSAQK